MNEPGFPVVTLQVEGFRRTIHAALMERNLKLDEDLKQAVDRACDPENVKQVIYDTARMHVEEALKGAVKHWFTHTTDGQKVIRDEVARQMETWYGLHIRDIAPSNEGKQG